MATFSVSSEADVVEVVRAARESRRTLEIVGHGTKRGFGRPVECDDVLDLSGITGIIKYEPDEMIVTARAGTPVTEIEAALAEHNQRLGFEPADWGPLFGATANSATIGGVLSASCDGSAAVRYGRCRDHLLGFRAVNGFGEAYKGGGKVVKNVTGFDLPKLFCGAMGTLGPLTEVTLRVFPTAKSVVYLAKDIGLGAGLALLKEVWKTPLEATGLAYLPKDLVIFFPELGGFGAGVGLIRIEGAGSALQEKHSMLRATLNGRRIVVAEDGVGVFQKVNSGTSFVNTMEDVWLLCMPHGKVASMAAKLSSSWMADWAGARLWERGTPGCDGAWQRDSAAELSGTATVVRASAETRKRVAPFPPEDRVRAELTKRVKAAFDPLRLFNPGRMWEGV